ncbi:hypothetical protein D3C77_616340 [compost metagenome]
MIIPIVVLLAPSDPPFKGIITFKMELALKYNSVKTYNRRKGQDRAPLTFLRSFLSTGVS